MKELRMALDLPVATMLKDLKAELALLRITKVTDGAPNKLSKIKVLRLSIAQVLTVILQKQKAILREAYKNKKFSLEQRARCRENGSCIVLNPRGIKMESNNRAIDNGETHFVEQVELEDAMLKDQDFVGRILVFHLECEERLHLDLDRVIMEDVSDEIVVRSISLSLLISGLVCVSAAECCCCVPIGLEDEENGCGMLMSFGSNRFRHGFAAEFIFVTVREETLAYGN
ncbi:hypothetical protein DKX38_019662 [Salix brachista]|uniref:60S ribosomal protein L35 n=1 Tax=Salix brachista TaxID=2182728 RepID=A0A5N5KGU2_9ROSI|nr:hypothetical protein DKX38_019662 [Salix brachista]